MSASTLWAHWLALWSSTFLATTALAMATEVAVVGRFDGPEGSPPPPPWRLVRFSDRIPPTRYRLRRWDGVAAVEARANASMALLARPLSVDLEHTPVLCWRWRVEAPLHAADLTRKSGDDYAARVYVAFRLPPGELSLALRTKLALARRLFGADTRMIVAQSGASRAGVWVEERHDVLADARRTFGTEHLTPTVLALATDTDNTGESALAGFADLHFVEREQPCQFPLPAAGSAESSR